MKNLGLKSSGQDLANQEDLAGGGGGGLSRSTFQVKDDGTTGQGTTGSASDVAGIWDTPTKTSSAFSWNGATGELTINEAGELDVTMVAQGWNNANNRNETHVLLLYNDGGGFVKIDESSNYSSRNNTQDEGGAMIPEYCLDVSAGDKIKMQVYDIGSTITIGAAEVAGQTRITAKLYN